MTHRPLSNRGSGQSTSGFSFFATCFQGVESVLAQEIRHLGGSSVRPQVRGVSFVGTLQTMMHVNLWCRTAHRILWKMKTFPAADRNELYDGVRSICWADHLTPAQTIAVDTVGTNNHLLHTQFTSRVVKDAVVDWFRDRTGSRPSVDTRSPDFRLNALIRGNTCTLSWDTSGERLHRRGYRGDVVGDAPLKENLAAAILLLSGYRGQTPLVDPMCGSGTLLVEAALIARNRAPGLLGRRYGFQSHPTFDATLWKQEESEARESMWNVEGCPVIGYDISQDAIRQTATAAIGSGTDDIIRVVRRELNAFSGIQNGMIVTNPPYGERLGDMTELAALYQLLGQKLRTECAGSSAHVMTGSRFLANRIGLYSEHADALWNGPLECRLLHFHL